MEWSTSGCRPTWLWWGRCRIGQKNQHLPNFRRYTNVWRWMTTHLMLTCQFGCLSREGCPRCRSVGHTILWVTGHSWSETFLRVFKCAALMQEIVSLAALQSYERHIEKLVMQWPGTWGLIYEADDRARAEQLERLRRQMIAEASVGRQVPASWDAARPWSCIFQQVVEDGAYWQECVHIPAAAWVAAGSKGKPTIASEAAILKMMPGGKEIEPGHHDGDDGERKRKSQANRDKRLAKRKRIQDELHELRKIKSGGKGDHGAKGKGKGKTKDQTGKPLCFAWASGSSPCGHLGAGAECLGSVKRVHKCRLCLSPSHQDKDCISGWSIACCGNKRGKDRREVCDLFGGGETWFDLTPISHCSCQVWGVLERFFAKWCCETFGEPAAFQGLNPWRTPLTGALTLPVMVVIVAKVMVWPPELMGRQRWTRVLKENEAVRRVMERNHQENVMERGQVKLRCQVLHRRQSLWRVMTWCRGQSGFGRRPRNG